MKKKNKDRFNVIDFSDFKCNHLKELFILIKLSSFFGVIVSFFFFNESMVMIDVFSQCPYLAKLKVGILYWFLILFFLK